MRKDEAWLVDILVACRHIREFVAGVSREQFLADRKLQSALCMELEPGSRTGDLGYQEPQAA